MYLHPPPFRARAPPDGLSPAAVRLQHDAETADAVLRLDTARAGKPAGPLHRFPAVHAHAVPDARHALTCSNSSASTLTNSFAHPTSGLHPDAHAVHPIHSHAPSHTNQPQHLHPAPRSSSPLQHTFHPDRPSPSRRQALPADGGLHAPPPVHLRPTPVGIYERPVGHRLSHLLFLLRQQAGTGRRIQRQESEDRPVNMKRCLQGSGVNSSPPLEQRAFG